jgi:hypothetical protein
METCVTIKSVLKCLNLFLFLRILILARSMGQAPVRLVDGKTYHLIVDFAILHYVDQIRVVLSTRPGCLLISSIFEVSTL